MKSGTKLCILRPASFGLPLARRFAREVHQLCTTFA
jgi:hypothetical protein